MVKQHGIGFYAYNPLMVSFQFKNPDFVSKNPDFLLKNPDFIITQAGLLSGKYSASSASDGGAAKDQVI